MYSSYVSYTDGNSDAPLFFFCFTYFLTQAIFCCEKAVPLVSPLSMFNEPDHLNSFFLNWSTVQEHLKDMIYFSHLFKTSININFK